MMSVFFSIIWGIAVREGSAGYNFVYLILYGTMKQGQQEKNMQLKSEGGDFLKD